MCEGCVGELCETPGCLRSDICWCGKRIVPPAYKQCRLCCRMIIVEEEVDASDDAYAKWFDAVLD